MRLFLKKIYKNRSLLVIITIILSCQSLNPGAFVEFASGYNIPFGEWSKVFGKGFCFGGVVGFSFSEYVNPGIGGFLIFPKTGRSVETEYKRIHDTESISLFTTTGFIYLGNRMEFALSEKNIITVEIGYGFHSQRNNVTVIYNSYECIDNFSGSGPFIGFGLKKNISFSIFDYIHPFLKLYYSPNKVYYHIIDRSFSIDNFYVADKRIGVFVGITIIVIGEE